MKKRLYKSIMKSISKDLKKLIINESVFDDDIFDEAGSAEEVSDDIVNKIRPYVDLGLPSGTLWCKCNVGAKKPYEYGNYFAWGETKPKESYSHSNYSDTIYNKYDGKKLTMLLLRDDAAHVNMNDGFNWHMPTGELFEELLKYTKNEWVDNYNGSGVSGRIFRGKNSNNELFIPAAGCKFDSHYTGDGSYCNVWSSYVNSLNPYDAYCLYFDSGYIDVYYDDCYSGFCVRGVLN